MVGAMKAVLKGMGVNRAALEYGRQHSKTELMERSSIDARQRGSHFSHYYDEEQELYDYFVLPIVYKEGPTE